MTDSILHLAVLAVFCGATLTLTPSGGVKDIMQILCTAVLIICVLNSLGDFNFEQYVRHNEQVEKIEDKFSEDLEKSESNLKQTIMQQQCREYILCNASELGMKETQVKILMKKTADGEFLPDEVEIKGAWSAVQKEKLSEIIARELGVDVERQRWHHG